MYVNNLESYFILRLELLVKCHSKPHFHFKEAIYFLVNGLLDLAKEQSNLLLI